MTVQGIRLKIAKNGAILYLVGYVDCRHPNIKAKGVHSMRIDELAGKKQNWPEVEKKEPNADTEINRMKLQIDKDSKEISDLSKEMAEMAAKGDKDMANLKSVEIQQKQMTIQTLRLQIDQLENPKGNSKLSDIHKNNSVEKTDINDTAASNHSTDFAIEVRPAVTFELSRLAKNLLDIED